MDTFGGNTGSPVPQGGTAGTPINTAIQPGNTDGGYITPATTFDASKMTSPTQSPNFPQTTSVDQTVANANSTNASVLSPTIPSAQSIIAQGAQQTPGEQTNNSLLKRLAGLVQPSLDTQKAQQETAAGVYGPLQDTVSQFSNQLEGLNNQSLALQTNAGPGGTIQNQNILNAQGRGISSQGSAYQSDLMNNQIQQATIAAQSLTVKSALFAAQNKLTNAKNAADAAAQVAFGIDQAQIDQVNALIDANKPQMTKEEKAQADLVTSQLNDRQTQINLQIDNFKTGQAAIADALKNNPNDANAQYAVQQAAQLDPKDPQYLQKVNQLVGKYGTDLTQRALQQQLTRAQIANLGTQKQDSLEQQYRTALEKGFSSRSGSLGLQSQKVDQAIHLRTLLDQYKDAQGNYNVPPAQYAELAQGMAALVSGNNSLSDSRVNDIQSASAQGDLGKALQYATGQTYSGSTQSIVKNLSDSIDRQGLTSQQLRDQYFAGLKGLKPTGLDQGRADAITQSYLPNYSDAQAGKYGAQQDSVGVINPDGTYGTIPKSQLTDALKQGYKLQAAGMDTIK